MNVYKANIQIDSQPKKVYFKKKGFCYHKTSFAHIKYSHNTSLLKHIWDINNKYGMDPMFKCKIVKKDPPTTMQVILFSLHGGKDIF